MVEIMRNRLVTGLKVLASSAVLASGGWILYSHLGIDHDVPLSDAIPAERRMFEAEQAGQLSYYVDDRTSGRPLVLIHSVNAAASAYEMRPLFQHYRQERPVYALDLPGYGLSERSNRVYTPQLFRDAILALLKSEVGEPADVVALSLGSEFATASTLARPEAVRSLTLISPTGFDGGRDGTSTAPETGISAHDLLSFPLWRRPLFDLIATRTSIRYFLSRSFVGPVPDDFVDYAYTSAHQPGAEHAPLYFLSGKLFTPNVRSQLYDKIKQPTLVLYDRDPYVAFDQLPAFVESRPPWQAERIAPSRGLPHFEQLDRVTDALDAFWQGLEPSAE